jgi:NADPH2:quinone reductase
MVKAVRIHEYGGPEVLRYEDVATADPGPGEALVRHTAIGLNYVDVMGRIGPHPFPPCRRCWVAKGPVSSRQSARA